MYQKIMVPVDLAHLDALGKALATATDLARHYQAGICYVGVTATTPGRIARTPEEYQSKLEAFAKEQGEKHGLVAQARVYTAADPLPMLDDLILKAIDESSADLLVMATHLPKRLDAVMPSNGNKVASHTDISVFLVRA